MSYLEEPTEGQFGSLLLSMRRRAGLSMGELAERTQTTVHSLQTMEGGGSDPPRANLCGALINALELTDNDAMSLLAAAGVSPEAIAYGCLLRFYQQRAHLTVEKLAQQSGLRLHTLYDLEGGGGVLTSFQLGQLIDPLDLTAGEARSLRD